MDSEGNDSLKAEWERTDKTLSDLLALVGQQQSKVASTALEAQQQSQKLRRISRELALELPWPDSPSELEYKEAACKISMKEDSKRLQKLLSLIQSRRKLIDIEAADQSLSSLGEIHRSRAYVKQAANLGDLWDEGGPATIGTWKAGGRRHVYVEWKDLSSEKSSERKDAMWERIQDLGDVLSSKAGLNVLPFLAIIQKRDDHWGFVYELPESTKLDSKSQTKPSTLRDLIGEQYKPSLSARMRLGLSLATSLLNFHLIGWLHKSIRSEHVMFFPENPSQRSLRRPRWVGLTYARGDTDFSERTAR
ncbi:MAG: hypothetical protein OHK93_008034 [Ramalina farinacea]|uniref:Protein kinase domain-containing protein n=1 Tax=Ramalina farinacea TaxID=258253 RepID=A0AA43QLP0_9LECA|nr:hypothetical protein [Ramalina farinacea]